MTSISGTIGSVLLLWLLGLLAVNTAAIDSPTETYLHPVPGSGASCDARFTTPCARTNSRWLAETVGSLLYGAVGDPDEFQAVLQSINDKKLNRDVGFYPFVFNNQGKCVAHGSSIKFVGMHMEEIYDSTHLSAYADPAALNERFRSAHHSWVSYLWSDNGVHIKLAYIINNITAMSDGQSYYLGVGFQNDPLPADLPCSDRFDRWCSLTNVRRLVGRAQFELEQADTEVEFESTMHRISFDSDLYKVPKGFYLFMYSFDGIIKAHGVLREDSFGKTLWDVFVDKELGSSEEGRALHETFRDAVSSSEHPESWVQYPWRDSLDGDSYTKVALLVEVEFRNDLFYVGAGFRYIGMSSDEDMANQSKYSPLGGEVCSDQYNLPCSFRTAHQLSSHALAYAVSSPLPRDEVFRAISRDPDFKHGNFYIFAYSFDTEICVAHGGNERYVGKSLNEIFEEVKIPLNSTELFEQFRTAATQGGGWVKYDWINLANLDQPNFKKISYIFQFTVDGKDYYGGIGFNHLRYPLEKFSEKGFKQNGDPIPCSQEFGLACSEINARGILGMSLAELIMSSSEASAVEAVGTTKTPIEDVLNSISLQDPNFTVNDFTVKVFSFDSNPACKTNDGSGCAIAYGASETYVGMTWDEILEADGALTIQGALLHRNLMDASNSGSGVFTYPYEGTNRRAWVAQYRHDGELFYVAVDYLTADMGPTCLTLNGTNGCPSGMACTDGTDESFCKTIFPLSLWIPVVISIIAILLLAVTFRYIFIARKKKELDSQMTEMQRKIEAVRNIDDDIDNIDQAVDNAQKRRQSLIMKRAAIQGTPSTWTESPDTLVQVTPEDEEYWSILEKMRATIPNVYISKLWRVQNESLWSYYSFHKDRLEDNKIDPNERRVWHGTSSLDPSIVYADQMDGFMINFAAKGLWGRGIYFADNASYSQSYSYSPVKSQTSERLGGQEDEFEMFLTRLAVGKAVKLDQNRSLTVPPIDISTGKRYNSVTGHTAGSQVWIVYENGRAYPEYLVRYYTAESRDKSRSPYSSKKEARKSMRWSSSTCFESELSISVIGPDTLQTGQRQGFWEYHSDSGWVAYDAVNQAAIEKTFQDFKKTVASPRPSSVTIQGPEWKYEIDVSTMKQKNIQHPSSTERRIRFHIT